MASSLREIEEFSRLSPSDPLYIHQDPMPAGADIMTQQEAISELTQREESARVAGTVSPFESSWNPTNPNFRATAQNAISNMLGGSNISSSDNYLGGRVANTLTGLLDFAPVVGDAVGVGDTITSYRQGDMLGTGINALATGVGVLPLVGGPASKAVKAGGNRVRSALRGIDAWHGSPYEFENFSIDNIGTGAGLQAYGDGLYFAGNPERAIGYAELTREVDKSLMPAVANFFENDYSLSKARAGMKSAYPNATNTELDNALNEYYMHLDDQGYMYNVNLNVEPENLLDFDAPLSQQPEAVKRAAEFYNVKTSPSGMKEARGSDVYRAISQARQQPPFDSSSMNTGGPEASAYLNELGIKGIKYKAGTGEGANNYVMFDDSLIDTKRVNDKLTPSWMDQGARMARAQEGGFDMDNTYYHGTSSDFTELQPSTVGDLGGGIYVTPNPEKASGYAAVRKFMKRQTNNASPNVLPLRVKSNLNYLDLQGRSIMPFDDVRINNLKEQGYDGIRQFDADGNVIQMNVFDPKNIRSTNAEFDPTKADSSDLLSSISPTQSSLRNIA